MPGYERFNSESTTATTDSKASQSEVNDTVRNSESTTATTTNRPKESRGVDRVKKAVGMWMAPLMLGLLGGGNRAKAVSTWMAGAGVSLLLVGILTGGIGLAIMAPIGVALVAGGIGTVVFSEVKARQQRRASGKNGNQQSDSQNANTEVNQQSNSQNANTEVNQQINSQNANKEGPQQEQVDGKHVENQQDTGREKSGDKKDAENLILETSKNVSLISARNQNSNQNQKTKVYTKEANNAMSSSKGGMKAG